MRTIYFIIIKGSDNNMRVCYVGNSVSIHDFRFIEKLVEKGYETHVVTLVEPVKINGATYHKIPDYYYSLSSYKNFVELMKSRNALKRIIKKIKPDIIHAGWIPSHGFLTAVSGFHPFLLMPWGSDILIKPKLSRISRIATKFTIKKANMLTCDAEFVKQEIIELSGYPAEKIIVSPQGIDLKKFNHEKTDGSKIRIKLGWQDKKILIMTRNFEPIYGIKYFLRAIPDIIEEISDVRIILCGDGSLGTEIKGYVRKNELIKYVHFAGFIKNEDLPNYLAAADVYVSSSLSDGTSLSLLEAMACGLPVVVTDVPANMEWVEDGKNGFVVPRRNAEKLKEKIVYLLQDERILNQFSKRNIEIARERANWDKNFEKLEWMYQQLSEKR